MYDRVHIFFDKFDILSENQFGFKTIKNSELEILELV